MSGHTKGPWTFHKVQGKHPHPFVCGPKVPVEYGEDCFLTAYLVGVDSASNGPLVAASPELLDCLKESRKHLDNADIDLAYIDEVIAKAEGRT